MSKTTNLFLGILVFLFSTLAYTDSLPSHAYIVGSSDTTSTGIGTAYLWKIDLNGTVLSTTTLSKNAQALGVAVSSNRVYSTGGDGSNVYLWITDLNGTLLSTTTLLTSENSSPGAYAVAVYNGFVYSVGTDNTANLSNPGTAYLWKTDLDGKLLLTTTLASSADLPFANSIAVSSTGIYIVGFDALTFNNATVWKTNLNGTSPSTTTLTSSLVFGVAVSPNNVYVVGSYHASSYNASLWTMDPTPSVLLQTNLLTSSNPEPVARGVAFYNNRIYSVGEDDLNHAYLWITDLSSTSTSQKTLLTTSSNTAPFAASVAAYNGLVYSVGGDDADHAYLWITDLNGNNLSQINLLTSLGTEPIAFGIAVYPLSPSALLMNSLNQHSPLFPIQGIR